MTGRVRYLKDRGQVADVLRGHFSLSSQPHRQNHVNAARRWRITTCWPAGSITWRTSASQATLTDQTPIGHFAEEGAQTRSVQCA